MGTCICGGDDRYTHAHYDGTRLVKVTPPAPSTFGPLSPVYAPLWRPMCAACAAAVAAAGLFLNGAQCLHSTPFVWPV